MQFSTYIYFLISLIAGVSASTTTVLGLIECSDSDMQKFGGDALDSLGNCIAPAVPGKNLTSCMAETVKLSSKCRTLVSLYLVGSTNGSACYNSCERNYNGTACQTCLPSLVTLVTNGVRALPYCDSNDQSNIIDITFHGLLQSVTNCTRPTIPERGWKECLTTLDVTSKCANCTTLFLEGVSALDCVEECKSNSTGEDCLDCKIGWTTYCNTLGTTTATRQTRQRAMQIDQFTYSSPQLDWVAWYRLSRDIFDCAQLYDYNNSNMVFDCMNNKTGLVDLIYESLMRTISPLSGCFAILTSSIPICTAMDSQIKIAQCLSKLVLSVHKICPKCLVSTFSTNASTCVFGCISNPGFACGQCGLNFASAALTNCIPSNWTQAVMELLQGQMTEVMNQLLRSDLPNTACTPTDIDSSQVQTLRSHILRCLRDNFGLAACLTGYGYMFYPKCSSCLASLVDTTKECATNASCVSNAVSKTLKECTGIGDYVVDGVLLNVTTGAPTTNGVVTTTGVVNTTGVVTTSPSSASALFMSIVMLMITLIHL